VPADSSANSSCPATSSPPSTAGRHKPDVEFFVNSSLSAATRPDEIAYFSDRLDNDPPPQPASTPSSSSEMGRRRSAQSQLSASCSA
jgi:hypothetical protein